MLLASLRRRAARAATHLPPRVLRSLVGPPEIVDGQALDLQVQAGLAVARVIGPRLETMKPERARRAADAAFAPYKLDHVAMARVFDERVSGPGPDGPGRDLAVRVLVPSDHRGGMLVWFHGGGGVIGSIAGSERFCRHLAAGARCAVATVEYRLGPEHLHPAAVDDALAAWPWLCERAARWGADPARVAVGGDSFGGYLAAWVERRARVKPRAQVLVYPLVDHAQDARSFELFGEGYALTRELAAWFRDNYIPDRAAWRAASPLHFADHAGAPPTLIAAAGFDPLRDEGRVYADRLSAGGAEVTYHGNGSLIHGWIDLGGACDAARAAADATATWLGAALERT